MITHKIAKPPFTKPPFVNSRRICNVCMYPTDFALANPRPGGGGATANHTNNTHNTHNTNNNNNNTTNDNHTNTTTNDQYHCL